MRLQAVGMATETAIITHSGFTAAKVWFDSWYFNSPFSVALNVCCQTGNLIDMNDHSKSVWKQSLPALWHLNLCLKKNVSWLNVADGCYSICFMFKKSVFYIFWDWLCWHIFMDFVNSVRVLDCTIMSAASSSFQILLSASLS